MADKKLLLKNVRLSFPSLFKREEFEGKEGKFAATFLISKSDTETKGKIVSAIQEATKESGLKIPKDRWCIKNGDDSEYDGYEGNYSLKASNSKRPTVIDRDRSPLTEDDDKLYAGCYVNAIVAIWIQNNKYGKRANANLLGVQFLKDGEPFGEGPVDVTDDFDELDGSDDLDDGLEEGGDDLDDL